LCHRAGVEPIFRADDFKTYQAVNARFAAAVCEEVDTESPLVLVQDYHFALAPHMIRRRLPLSTIIAFWHTPWPTPRRFGTCPWRRQLLKGLLGSSIVGFQTPDDCRNFVDTVGVSLEAQIDRRHGVITHAGRQTSVRVYPASVDWRRMFDWASASIAWITPRVSARNCARSSGCSNHIQNISNGLSSSRLPSRAGTACRRIAPSDRSCGRRRIESTIVLAPTVTVRLSCSRHIMTPMRSIDFFARQISVSSGACTMA
jgi:hypothetical protein